MSVTPTWATALLSLIGFLLVVLMILAWVAMFGDECSCCYLGAHCGGSRWLCCPARMQHFCGYYGEDTEIIESCEDESSLTTDLFKGSPTHHHHHHHHHHHPHHHPHQHNNNRTEEDGDEDEEDGENHSTIVDIEDSEDERPIC